MSRSMPHAMRYFGAMLAATSCLAMAQSAHPVTEQLGAAERVVLPGPGHIVEERSSLPPFGPGVTFPVGDVSFDLRATLASPHGPGAVTAQVILEGRRDKQLHLQETTVNASPGADGQLHLKVRSPLGKDAETIRVAYIDESGEGSPGGLVLSGLTITRTVSPAP